MQFSKHCSFVDGLIVSSQLCTKNQLCEKVILNYVSLLVKNVELIPNYISPSTCLRAYCTCPFSTHDHCYTYRRP